MRASTVVLIMLMMSRQGYADKTDVQAAIETGPDADLLEFIVMFEQKDSGYIDELLDEHQDDKLKNDKGEQNAK